MRFWRDILIGILMLIQLPCFSITKISINQHSIHELSELWNLQILSDFNEPKITIVRMMVYNSTNTLLYESQSENFLLQAGVFNFNGNQTSSITTRYLIQDMEELNRSSELKVQLYLLDPVTNLDIAQFNETVYFQSSGNLLPNDSSVTKPNRRDKIKKYFAATGNMELTGLYNTRSDTIFYLPTDYFRLKLHTAISIYDVPFTYDMYVTTEQKHTKQKLNSFSFKFDVETFKNNMIAKVSKKLQSISKVNSVDQLLKNPEELENFNTQSILDSLKKNKQLSPQLIEKYKEYSAIDSLKNKIGISDDITLKKTMSQLKKLTKNFDSMTIDSLYKMDMKNTLLINKEMLEKESPDSLINYDSTRREKHTIVGLLDDTMYAMQDKINAPMNESISKTDTVIGQITDIYSVSTDRYKNSKDSLLGLGDKLNTTNAAALAENTISQAGKKLFKNDTAFAKADTIVHKLADAYTKLDERYKNKDSVLQIGKNLNVKDAASLAEGSVSQISKKIFKNDTVAAKVDTVTHKLLETYSKISKYYAGNKDSMLKMVGKINNYSIDDLLSFAKINNVVNDKIGNYKHYVNKQELDKLRKLNVKDFNQYASVNGAESLLKKYNLLSKKERLLKGIRNMDIGTVYPYYSDYTINGVIINGYNIAYNYKKLYIGSSGGKQINVFNDSILQVHRLKKNLLFGFVLGYGDKSSNHIHIDYVFGIREIESVTQSKSKYVNHVISPEFKYSLLKGKVIVKGELPVSLTTKNGRDSLGSNKLEIGYANKIRMEARIKKNTLLTMSNEYVDNKFTSYGVPFLLKNYLHSVVNVEQKINAYLNIEGAYKLDNYFRNAERETASIRIHTLQLGATAHYKALSIYGAYAPGWVESEAKKKTMIHSMNLNSTINYKIKKAKCNTQFGISYNSFYNSQIAYSTAGAINIENNILNINKNINVYAGQNILVKDKYSIYSNFSFINNHFYGADNKKIIIFGSSYSHLVNRKFRYSVSLQFANDIKNSRRYNIQAAGIYRINKYFEISTKLQYDYLQGTVQDIYHKTSGFQVITSAIVRF